MIAIGRGTRKALPGDNGYHAAMKTMADIIRAKRDGGELDAEDLRAFVNGVADESVGDAQIGAFLMAMILNGASAAEQAALTLAMRDSGAVLEWQDLDGPVLDKHSTGGVGDLVSLVLAPLVAACGAYIPMISGRGLGHTGGTLDKLESIPGFRVNPSLAELHRIVREAGFAIVGQGPELAPADRRMYAVRDVTATVESISLITASILSKKLAEGLDGLVMDVKTGNGAFLSQPGQARELADNIVRVAAGAGLPTTAVLTDMDQPLASSAGNALELREAVDWLRGGTPNPRLHAVTLALAVEMLLLGDLESERASARERLQRALDSGAAAERFARMVALQGGPGDLLDAPDRYLVQAPVVMDIPAPRSGHVAAMDTRTLGMQVVLLGGGRQRVEDTIDPRVGLDALCRIGDRRERGEPLARVHADSRGAAESTLTVVQAAIRLSDAPVSPPDAVLGRIDH